MRVELLLVTLGSMDSLFVATFILKPSDVIVQIAWLQYRMRIEGRWCLVNLCDDDIFGADHVKHFVRNKTFKMIIIDPVLFVTMNS